MMDCWHRLMVWLDTSTVPLWGVVVVFLVYFLGKLWREVRNPNAAR